MIEFLTFFLGLVNGPCAVELSVDPSVAQVEILLDRRSVAVLAEPPWKTTVELGEVLVPRELTAIARDAAGAELERRTQWLNVPKPRAEARFSFPSAEPGRPPLARLHWTALDFEKPLQVAVFFDGQPLMAAESPFDFELPPFDDRDLHLVRAELTFSDRVEAEAEAVVGGRFRDEVTSELTAVPFHWPRRKRLPRPEEMEGWITSGGAPARVVAVERLPANLYVVREISERNFEGLKTLAFMRYQTSLGPQVEIPVGLAPGDRVRFFFPVAARRESKQEQQVHFIENSQNVAGIADGTLFAVLTASFFETFESDPSVPSRLADAVAVAGISAAASSRARAVLLIHSGASERDRSRFEPAAARELLSALRVPLVVWTPPGQAAVAGSPWGEAMPVTSLARAGEAIGDLRDLLDTQIVVWLEGAHVLPRIEITSRARNLSPIE